jgi:rhamnulokinase
LLVQAMSLGEVTSLAEAREIVAASFGLTTYEPSDTPVWREAHERFAAAVALPTLEVRA